MPTTAWTETRNLQTEMSLDPINDIKPAEELVAEAKQEYKFIGKIVLKKGCRLYGWNYVTDKLDEVIMTKDLTITKHGKAEVKQKATHAADTLYIQAINLSNARRKANNLKNLIK